MTYVIADPCVDVMDKSCIELCPVDCIYEGGRQLYINGAECIECGACEPACPVGAVFYHEDVPDEYADATATNEAFFTLPLPGRTEPLGNPGGARHVGPIGVDHHGSDDAETE